MYFRDMNKLLEKTFGICVKKDVAAEENSTKKFLFELKKCKLSFFIKRAVVVGSSLLVAQRRTHSACTFVVCTINIIIINV